MYKCILCFITGFLAKKCKILVFDDHHALYNEDERYFITKCGYSETQRCNQFICTLHSIFSGRMVEYGQKDNLCEKVCKMYEENGSNACAAEQGEDSGQKEFKELGDVFVEIPTDFTFHGMSYPQMRGVVVLCEYGMGRIVVN